MLVLPRIFLYVGFKKNYRFTSVKIFLSIYNSWVRTTNSINKYSYYLTVSLRVAENQCWQGNQSFYSSCSNISQNTQVELQLYSFRVILFLLLPFFGMHVIIKWPSFKVSTSLKVMNHHIIFQIITHKLNYEIININKIHSKHEYSSPIFQVHIILKVDFLFHLFCLLVCIMRRCDQCECVYSNVSHRLQNA